MAAAGKKAEQKGAMSFVVIGIPPKTASQAFAARAARCSATISRSSMWCLVRPMIW
jgi:hypothetical protein